MAGRTGIGGRARRRSGLLEALIDAGFAASPPRPQTWRGLLAATVVCDEVAPQLAQDPPLDWLHDLGDSDQPAGPAAPSTTTA